MCGASAGGASLEGVDLSKQSVIQGVVNRDESPLAGAYVRLLDSTGEFVAELPTNTAGQFRFFAAPGSWTVRTLAPGADPVDRPVVAVQGEPSELEISVG